MRLHSERKLQITKAIRCKQEIGVLTIKPLWSVINMTKRYDKKTKGNRTQNFTNILRIYNDKVKKTFFISTYIEPL